MGDHDHDDDHAHDHVPDPDRAESHWSRPGRGELFLLGAAGGAKLSPA
jgi:hypothetical protein